MSKKKDQPEPEQRRRYRVKKGYVLHDTRSNPPRPIKTAGEEFFEGDVDLEGQRHKVRVITEEPLEDGLAAGGTYKDRMMRPGSTDPALD